MALDALLHALRRGDQAGLTPLTGGRNNAIFAATSEGRAVCLKRYRIDERRRGRREWEALNLVHRVAPGIVPEPLASLLDEMPEIVAMERVDGSPLDANPEALDAYAAALRRLHAAIRPDTPGAPTRTTIATPPYLVAKLDTLLAATPGAPADALRALWEPWKSGPQAQLLAAPALHPVFTQGDHGLNNALWDGRRLRLVDWEYGGWTERALDLADMVEHGQSRAVADETWEALLETFPLTIDERRRLDAARRLFALFWAGLWLPRTSDELPRFTAQLARCRTLA